MQRTRRERGAAAVELALLLPLIALLLVGIMEFGFAFYIQGALAGAARTGVRSYSINYSTTDSTVDATAQASARALAVAATPEPAKAAVTSLIKCTAVGAQTTLVVTYQYSSLTGWFGNTMTLTGKGTMRCAG